MAGRGRRLIPDPGSTSLAFVLIAVLAMMILLSALIPQRGLAEDQILDWRKVLGRGYVVIETLRLDSIYFSPPFFVLLSLLAVNLVVGNVRRFRTVLRVERTLLKARHVGSIVFHLSLLVILVGTVLNYLFKFQGIFALTEGQTLVDEPPRYFRSFSGPLFDGPWGRFEITLDEVDEHFVLGDGETEAAFVRVRAATGAEAAHAVRINRPLVHEGLEFHLGAETGYSPELVVREESGGIAFRGFVRLATHELEDRTLHEDFVPIGGDVRVYVTVVPAEESGGEPGRSIRVTRGGETLFEGAVPPDRAVRAGTLEVSVPSVRRWCYISVVRNPFLGVVFAGFWSGLGGLSITALSRVSWSDRRNG